MIGRPGPWGRALRGRGHRADWRRHRRRRRRYVAPVERRLTSGTARIGTRFRHLLGGDGFEDVPGPEEQSGPSSKRDRIPQADGPQFQPEKVRFREGVESVLTPFAVDSPEALHSRLRYRLFGAVEAPRFELARLSPLFRYWIAAILRSLTSADRESPYTRPTAVRVGPPGILRR